MERRPTIGQRVAHLFGIALVSTALLAATIAVVAVAVRLALWALAPLIS